MALDALKASIRKAFAFGETKSAVVPYDTWGLDAFLTPTTISNVAVTPQTAMRVPAVNAAVTLIASSIGTLPAKIMRTVDGSKESADDHPAFPLVAKMANDRVSAGKLRERLAYDALLYGNGFGFANIINGRVVEIIRLDPQAVSVQLDLTTGDPIYRAMIGTTYRVLDPKAVIHIPAPVSFDGVNGVSPITLNREAIALAITMEARAARLFGLSARPGGVIEAPSGLGDDALKRMRDGWKAAHEGVDNSGKTPILYDGAQFKPLQFSSVDSQFLEMRIQQTVEIARAFDVPVTMLSELSRGTFANTEQQNRQFVTYTLRPWLSTFKDEFERVLLSEDERADHSIEFDTDALVGIDTAARTDKISKLRSSGVYTANDARRELGLPAHADGDRLDSPHTTPGSAPSKQEAQA